MSSFGYKYAPGPDGCEDLEKYEPGGYHPVRLGDVYSRFEVVHKLGSGGSATIWLARDTENDGLVALKILTAESSERNQEVRIHTYLHEKCSDTLEATRVAAPMEWFEFNGPNGSHLCLVFEVLGPSIGSLREFSNEFKVRPEKIRVLARQLIEGLIQLHKNGVVLSDVSAYNILFTIRGIHSWSVQEIYRVFGKPQGFLVRRAIPIDPNNLPPQEELDEMCAVDEHAPQLVYRPLEFLPTVADLVEPELVFIDLGEAFMSETPPKSLEVGVNVGYMAPELSFDEYPTPGVDIWVLATVLFELRTGQQLFREGFMGGPGVLKKMIGALGPLPLDWQEEIEKDFEREYGSRNWPMGDPANLPSLKQRMAGVGKLNRWHFMTLDQRRKLYLEMFAHSSDYHVERMISCFNHPPTRFSRAESRQFHDLLSRMMKYKPADRIGLEEVLFHPWVRKEIKAKKTRDWLVRYDPGRQVRRLT